MLMITDKFEIKDFDSFIIGNSYGIEQCWYKEKGTLIHHLAYREGCGYVSILNMYLYLKWFFVNCGGQKLSLSIMKCVTE
jgi:hypothetical protein